MRISKEKFKETTAKIYIDLDEKLLDSLCHYSESLLTNLEHLSTLDVEGLEEMHYPFDVSSHVLREDVTVPKLNNRQDYLKNVKHRQDKFVVVK